MKIKSVTQRVKNVSQPLGGYVPKKLFVHEKYEDYNKVIAVDRGVAPLQGMAVDLLTRYMLIKNSSVFSAIRQSARLLDHINSEEENIRRVNKLIAGVKAIDVQSAMNICELCEYEEYSKSGKRLNLKNLHLTNEFYNNICILTKRTISFFEKCDKLVGTGVQFNGAYTNLVTIGELDYLTESAIIDLKVAKKEVFSKWSLQLLMYYLLGIHANKDIAKLFKDVKNIIIFNAYTNESYSCNVDTIPDKTMYAVSHDVIGFNMSSRDVTTWRSIGGTGVSLLDHEIQKEEIVNFDVNKYEDGVHTIKPKDYWFYIQQNFFDYSDKEIGKRIESLDEIKFLKKTGYIMFIGIKQGKLYLLQGGTYKRLANSVDYYYSNMDKYADKVLDVFAEYWGVLDEISEKIKLLKPSEEYLRHRYERYVHTQMSLFGKSMRDIPSYKEWCSKKIYGDTMLDKDRGKIHGCIVDIDYFNHIFVNPNDMTVAPYYANSITDKYVFKNVQSLLAAKRVELLPSYCELSKDSVLENISTKPSMLALFKDDSISMDIEQYMGTDIYSLSLKLKVLQQIYCNNLIQVWYDTILTATKGLNTNLYLLAENKG